MYPICTDPDKVCGAVTDKILEGMRRCIPQKRLLTRPSDLSWWTPECTIAARQKQNAWNRFQKQPSKPNADIYSSLRSERYPPLQSQESRNGSCSTLLSKQTVVVHPESSWRGPPSVQHTSDSPCKRNWARHQPRRGRLLWSVLLCKMQPGRWPQCWLSPWILQTRQLCPQRVWFRPATIEWHLKHLDPSKATGPDDTPARVLKHCAKALCLPLPRLFS